jgi:cytosine/adenosine deaminase-related metal-dependent hydrolase
MLNVSPIGRDADNLLAGYALGKMLIVVRLRGLVTEREDIVTMGGARAISSKNEGSMEEGRDQGGTNSDSDL